MGLTHLLAEPADKLWLMLMADDLKAASTVPEGEEIGAVGHTSLARVGSTALLDKSPGRAPPSMDRLRSSAGHLALGISASRARWATEWLARVARDGMTDLMTSEQLSVG